MITASAIERAKRCPGHVTLPSRDVPTKWSVGGSVRHAEYKARIDAGDIPEDLETRWPGLSWRAEVKFALDLSTGDGRELGQGDDRDYSDAGPFELVGTADAVGMGLGKLVIVDWKSFVLVPDALENPQLLIAALAISRAHDHNAADVAIHYEARPMDVAELDAFDLDAFEIEVRKIIDEAGAYRQRAAAGGPVDFVRGEWCKHCPGFYDCPKQKALQEQIERHPALVASDKATLPFLDDDDAAVAYEFYERAKLLVKKLGEALHARGASRPIPLHNGKLFGPRTKPGSRRLDGDIVYDIMKAKYGQAVADAAVGREATLVQIKAALKLAGVKSVAAAEREVIAEADKRGGVTKKPTTSFEEFDPELPQLKAANE